MMPLHVVLLVFLSVQDQAGRPECRPWQECRQLALDAASREDYEAFHDLAWRAVQTGPRNDADLMYLLARAQSLSGRPGDALVMLERLAQMGVQTDAVTSEDFRRVRALPAWPDAEARLKTAGRTDDPGAPPAAAAAEPVAPAAATPSPAPKEEGSAAAPDVIAPPRTATRKPAPAPRGAPPEKAARSAAAAAPASAPARDAPSESLRFTTLPFTPAGLAYDAVSRRFIVGDRDARKLAVVDEFSHHVANLASARSSGFGDIAALEIDVRQGNLWVVSNDATADGPDGSVAAGTDSAKQATLHKLQLVSGRLLASYVLPARLGSARFADVATMATGAVIVLDTEGNRLLRLAPGAKALEVAAPLPEPPATSVAPALGDVVYVANREGVVAVNLGSRASTSLRRSKGVDVAGIARLRWHKGSLVAVQQSEEGYRAITIALGRNGRTATAVQVLDASLSTSDPTAATVSGGMLYYLASGEGGEMIVRKAALH